MLFVFSVLFFFGSLRELLLRWFASGSYYSQGPFVFAIFLWILKKRYGTFNRDTGDSPVAGFSLLSIALAAEVFGRYAAIVTSQFSAIYLFILGCSFLFLGKYFVNRNKGLFVYLLLAIPLPAFLLDHATFYLKLAAAGISGFFLSLMYPATSLHGTTLNINNYVIEITPACSGMQNIFGMASLLWCLALFQKRNLIAAVDYLIAIPAALLSNILRIIIVTILTVHGYGKYALGAFHEVIGTIVFIIIFVLITLINDVPNFKTGGDEKTADGTPSSEKKKNYMVPLIIIMALMAAGSLAIQLKSSGSKEVKYPLLINSIGTEAPGWKSRDEKLGEIYFSMLKTDDVLMREYYKADDTSGKKSVYLYFIHARGDRTPFLHRPELCLKNEGYNLLSQSVLALPSGRTVTRMLFIYGEKGLLVYYWYRYNGKDLGGYMDLQYAMLTDFGNNRDCSMIRLSRIVDPRDVERGEVLLREFAEKGTPLIFKNIF